MFVRQAFRRSFNLFNSHNRLPRFSPVFLFKTLSFYHSSVTMSTSAIGSNANAVTETSSELKALKSTGYVTISEGTANMEYDAKEEVFYNKVMIFNRDISIQVIRLFAEIMAKERAERYAEKMERYKAGNSNLDREPFPPPDGISVLDALAATGLRSVRFMKEIPGIRHLYINDLLKEATDVAETNCRNNGVDTSKITISNRDATMLMYEHRAAADQFDVIDLDPYGSAAPFIDSAVQSISHGGLLCVTCTDMPVLTGSFPEVAYAKYGSMTLKAKYLHEMSLRILLHSIDAAANKYKRHIVPWISISVDYYIRVFVRVYESPVEVKNSCLRRCNVFQSTLCPSFYVQPVAQIKPFKKAKPGETGGNYNCPDLNAVEAGVCPETGARLKIGGPYWADPIHNQVVVDELLRRVENCPEGSAELPFAVPTGARMIGVLSAISEELKDIPFYYSLPDLASCLQIQTPTHNEFKSAIINAGYRVSCFHHDSTAMKTDAPASLVWDIMRSFAKMNPPKGSAKKKQSPGARKILENPITKEIDFTFNPKALVRKVARFPPNPEANWGPKRGAGRLLKDEAKKAREAALAAAAAVTDSSCSSSNGVDNDGAEVAAKRPRTASGSGDSQAEKS